MHLNTKRFTPALSALLVSGLALLAGCSTTSHRAPVEDRPVSQPAQAKPVPSGAAAGTPSAAASAPEAPKPGAENAGKPGYYTVKPGDALIRIALDTGQNWRDLARWNGLENPNRIEVGQVLRVIAPGAEPGTASTRPIATAKVESRPLDSKPVAAASGAASAAEPAASSPSTTSAAPASDDDLTWGWPGAGAVLNGFGESRNNGLTLGGKAGDPVYAAASGRVMYAGSGLRGYGNVIIIKHNNTYLSAYGHNQTLLVKEDQVVRKGQRIADMGDSDADQVKLQFEVRKQGKPIDPAKLLPAR